MDVRTKPNQGIHRTAQSALIGGLIAWLGLGLGLGLVWGLALGLIGVFTVGLSVRLFGVLGFVLALGLVFGLVFGLPLGFLRYGGFTIIQHYTLRLFLALSGAAPLRLVRILDEARNRGLLVRVGGGYRFYHGLLRDYFAAQREPGQRWVAVVGEQGQAQLQCSVKRALVRVLRVLRRLKRNRKARSHRGAASERERQM